jgi:hypothetical protein
MIERRAALSGSNAKLASMRKLCELYPDSAMARKKGCQGRLERRANALLLLDKGWSCTKVAKALFLDDDTIRSWHKSFLADGLEGLIGFGSGGTPAF